jgi:hypothetical protein
MRTPEGPLIMDLDDVRVAPREWDLATISRRAHDGWSAEETPAFSAGYGLDWEGVFRRFRDPVMAGS